MTWLAFAVTAAIVLGQQSAPLVSQTELPQEQIFRELAQTYVGILRTENPTPPATMEEMMADDFLQSNSSGQVLKGKEANLAFNRTGIEEIQLLFNTFEVRFDIQRVKVFPDSALVFGNLFFEGQLKDGDLPFKKDILETMIFEKTPAAHIIQIFIPA